MITLAQSGLEQWLEHSLHGCELDRQLDGLESPRHVILAVLLIGNCCSPEERSQRPADQNRDLAASSLANAVVASFETTGKG